MELFLGIDDAGRGPVAGPMVLAGCILNKELEVELKELGVMDSKLLTRKKREDLLETIKKKAIGFKAHKITPSEIDTGMGIGLNLNQVEAMAAGIIINELSKGKKDLKIVIDCPSVNTSSWKKQLLEYVKAKDLGITCEHKADTKHVSVSAASIIAKVTRDAEIKKLHEKIGINFGSGYPNDPKTKQFLKKHINDPQVKKHRIFRETWATYKRAKQGKKQTKLPDY
jgi:ribonuclease HII